jgi:TPP-dependent pyruvate/acetoin dehydrogenase alpha subunit
MKAAHATNLPTADRELWRKLHASMTRIRMIEEEIARRYPEEKMRCPIHLSIGQEGVPVGVSAILRRDDQVVSTHRCHAHYLAKGGDLKAMIAELYGKATGCCGGRGGSMHLFDAHAGMLLSEPIVGSSIPVGVGAALGFQQQGRDCVAVVYLGDASLEEGVFHESANFAAVRSLPVIFVCENNLYSVYTHICDRQPPRSIESLAIAHGIPANHIDGNDVIAVRAAAASAVDRARTGQGPSFLLCDTYRWREHCGPNYDNDIGYRPESEFQHWKKLDPIERLRDRLVSAGAFDLIWQRETADAIRREIDEAFAAADEAPFPPIESLGAGLYA